VTTVTTPATTESPAGGYDVAGPSALAGDFRRFVVLTRVLAVQEFKLRFFGSVLGYLWQLMRPLMLFGVLYLVFAVALDLDAQAPFFAVALLMNVVLYTFFADATTASVRSVVEHENLVRKIQFPRLVIPASITLTACFNFGLNLIVVFIFAFASGVPVRPGWLLLPVLVFLLIALTVGSCMLLSALFVRFRDIQPIWDVVLQILFYGSPILYAIEAVQDKAPELASAMMASPLGAIMVSARHYVLDPTSPTAAEVIGSDLRLLVPLGIVVLAFGLGLWFFNHEAPRIAERL